MSVAILGWASNDKPVIARYGGEWAYYAAVGGRVAQLRNATAYDWCKERNRFAAAARAHAAFVREARRFGCPVPLDDIDERLIQLSEQAPPYRGPQVAWKNADTWGAAVQEVAGYGPFN